MAETEPTAFNYGQFAAELVKAHIEQIASALAKLGSTISDELRIRFTRVFDEYLAEAAGTYSKTKTIIYRNVPKPLYSFYEPLDLKKEGDTIRAAGIQALAKQGRRVIVSGLAGSGKSTFLKHIFLDAIRHKHSIPVLVELRRLNTSPQDLQELIAATIQPHRAALSPEHFERAFANGRFTLLLDAYDELNLEKREAVKKAILAALDKYPGVQVIMTSRPDDAFVGWQRFVQLDAMRLSKQQALSLIDKLEYDDDVKQRFILDLDRVLFKEHESFLSNPLLLTIMLMTYHENAEIPRKRHLFFAQVFQTLYSQHDALKDGYKRQMLSALAMDDFQKVLAAFSIQSLLNGEVTFSRDGALAYMRNAKQITHLNFGAEEFLEDLLRSVCLLVQDGLYLSFTHKQFQEYYAAYFIMTAPAGKQRKIIDRVAPGFAPNEVVRILFEMSQGVVEKHFILPGLRRLFKKIHLEDKVDEKCYLRYFQALVLYLNFFNPGVSYTINDSAMLEFTAFLRSAYTRQVVPRGDVKKTSAALANYVATRFNGAASKRNGERERHGVIPASEIETDPAFLKAAKQHSSLGIEALRYLLDVRDFVALRQEETATSLDDLLSL